MKRNVRSGDPRPWKTPPQRQIDITGLNFQQLEELRTRAEHRIDRDARDGGARRCVSGGASRQRPSG